jgi:hypothetical protein
MDVLHRHGYAFRCQTYDLCGNNKKLQNNIYNNKQHKNKNQTFGVNKLNKKTDQKLYTGDHILLFFFDIKGRDLNIFTL